MGKLIGSMPHSILVVHGGFTPHQLPESCDLLGQCIPLYFHYIVLLEKGVQPEYHYNILAVLRLKLHNMYSQAGIFGSGEIRGKC